jgi:hypothetical protein
MASSINGPLSLSHSLHVLFLEDASHFTTSRAASGPALRNS